MPLTMSRNSPNMENKLSITDNIAFVEFGIRQFKSNLHVTCAFRAKLLHRIELYTVVVVVLEGDSVCCSGEKAKFSATKS
jgi:hypothetical protein